MDTELTPEQRNRIIVRTGGVGIAANLGLSAAKAAIGFASGSLAIVLDAINSLTDAVSSIVTIVGVKLAAKPADKEHPMGYGRVEYLSALVVAAVVFATGIITFRDSVLKIIHPTLSTFDWVAVAVVVISIVVKIVLGLYTKAKGEQTRSDALSASGVDALFDALVTGATLLAIAVTMIWGITIDGWVSALISIVVAKSGWDMIRDIVSEILGERIDPDLANQLRREIESYDRVIGAHDLFLDAYGPNTMIGFVHLEVDAAMTATEIDVLSRAISNRIYEERHIILTCGVYGVAMDDQEWNKLHSAIQEIVGPMDGVISTHGLYLDKDAHHVYFDVVHDFSVKDVDAFVAQIQGTMEERYPQYKFTVTPDVDFAE